MSITVKAIANGYHPATGLHLEADQTYTIDEDCFADDVFELVESANAEDE